MKSPLQAWARRLKTKALTLWFVARHPATPWHAKALAAFAAAYAFSPIDLIPDFIPILGYLDDLVLLPLLIALAIRWVPRDVWHACRRMAEEHSERPISLSAAWIIGMLWVVMAMWVVTWLA